MFQVRGKVEQSLSWGGGSIWGVVADSAGERGSKFALKPPFSLLISSQIVARLAMATALYMGMHKNSVSLQKGGVAEVDVESKTLLFKILDPHWGATSPALLPLYSYQLATQVIYNNYNLVNFNSFFVVLFQ